MVKRRKPVERYKTYMEGRSTWELKNMKKALSMLRLLNTKEDEHRLKMVTEELRRRNKKVKK